MAATNVTSLDKQTIDELACTYASLILHDEKMPITSQNINKLITACGLKVDSFWPNIFAKSLEGQSVSDLLMGGPASGPAQGGAPAKEEAKPAEKKEDKKKEEPKKEEVEDVGMGGLFD